MATTLTINYKIDGIEKSLVLSEVTRCAEDFREDCVQLNLGCNDIVENDILSELMRSSIINIIYVEDVEVCEFNKYNRIYNIYRSYKGEGSSLSINLKNYL